MLPLSEFSGFFGGESVGVLVLRGSACGGRGCVLGLSPFAGVDGWGISEGDCSSGVSYGVLLGLLLLIARWGGFKNFIFNFRVHAKPKMRFFEFMGSGSIFYRNSTVFPKFVISPKDNSGF